MYYVSELNSIQNCAPTKKTSFRYSCWILSLSSRPILSSISCNILWISLISSIISCCVKGICDSRWTCWYASSDFLTITEINRLMTMKVPIKIKLAKYSQYMGPRFKIIGSITSTHPSKVMIWNSVVAEIGKDDQCCGSTFLKR